MDPRTPPTLWEVPDDVWTRLAPLLQAYYPAQPKGHRRVDRRRALKGLIFRRRTGGPWHPRPQPVGDDSPVPRPFPPWCQGGLFARVGAVLGEAGDDVGGVDR